MWPLCLGFDIAVGILEESLVKEPFSSPIGVVHDFGTSDPAALKASLQKKTLFFVGMGAQETASGNGFKFFMQLDMHDTEANYKKLVS